MRSKFVFFAAFVLLSLLIGTVVVYAHDAGPLEPDTPGAGLGKQGLSFRYVKTIGVSESPYNADNKHFERPRALAVDASQNIYLVDQNGSRVFKFNKNGVHQWTRGIPGMHYLEEGTDVFNFPRDVGVDSGGNIWVVDHFRVVQYDNNGVYQQSFPDWEDEPWRCGDDNGHFCNPGGVAFGNISATDYIFVSDSDNHRVQVFDISGPTPAYSTTIGVTGQPGSDDAHFDEPRQVEVDGSGNLYVADRQNARIQKCAYAAGWTCSNFHGTGSFGSGANELGHVEGIGSIPGTLYIADSSNNRLKKCSIPSGPCGVFATDVPFPTDVDAIIAEIVLVIHDLEFSVWHYNASGSPMADYLGTVEVPYKTDNQRLNRPWGAVVGKDGSLYVSEFHGNRVVKLDPSGNQVNTAWPVGEPGVWGYEDDQLDHPRGNLAVDGQGQILVPDTENQRVQVFDPDGDYVDTLGTTGERGSDKFHFDEPMGAAVSPQNGDIYVADSRNHRVQVFKSNYQWKATLGQTGNSGSGNNQFNQPQGVFVDKNGDIYVADSWNHRVQVFDENRSYKATLGVTGQCKKEFGYLCSPQSVVVDNQGRIYAAEGWQTRVQVYDNKYNYLTTIGGEWGSTNGGFREIGGLALDKAGSLYIVDSANHRVQKFARGVFGWQQSNIDGFGEIDNAFITTLKPLNSSLVAGTFNSPTGAQLWKLENGAWTSLIKGGFGHSYNLGITYLIDFKDKYYAGTSNSDTEGGEIWRSANLTNWSRVVKDGFGTPANAEINAFEVFKDMLYASTWNWSGAKGGEIWRTASGNSGDWTRVVSNGFGNSENAAILFLVTYKDMLYASTVNFVTGGEVWRSDNGKSWIKVSSGGFGDQYNRRIFLVPDTDNMYAGTWNYKDSDNPGGELWRCSKCDGSDWAEVPNTKGFGGTENRSIFPVEVPGNSLYAFTENRSTGLQVWMAEDGENFRKVSPDGFGEPRNYFPTGIAQYDKKLFVGTGNWFANAGEVWMREGFYYLPNIFKD